MHIRKLYYHTLHITQPKSEAEYDMSWLAHRAFTSYFISSLFFIGHFYFHRQTRLH